ncbi:MAG: hypothetical protein ACE5IT_09175 [bacterium]
MSDLCYELLVGSFMWTDRRNECPEGLIFGEIEQITKKTTIIFGGGL